MGRASDRAGQFTASFDTVLTDAAPSQSTAPAPRPDHPVADLSQEQIKGWPVLGGPINEYEPAA